MEIMDGRLTDRRAFFKNPKSICVCAYFTMSFSSLVFFGILRLGYKKCYVVACEICTCLRKKRVVTYFYQ
jgi:hypothetical protein